MPEVVECKAAWRSVMQGAWRRWRLGEPRCAGTREEGRGSGPSADLVGQAGADQLGKKVGTMRLSVVNLQCSCGWRMKQKSASLPIWLST